MPPRSFVYVPLGVLALMLGLLSGIFRLMGDNGVYTGVLSPIYGSHSVLMVCGFIATLIMTERVAGLRVLSAGRPLVFTSTLMVPLTWLGAMAYTVGQALGSDPLSHLGVALLLLGVALFVATLYMLSKLSHMATPFLYMVLSAFYLMVGALELLFGAPWGNIGMIMLFLGFPLVFILGERVELMGFLTATTYRKRFLYAAYGLTLALTLFAAGSAASIMHGENAATRVLDFVGFIPLLAVMAAYYAIENTAFKRLARSAQPIQRYVAAHTRIAYVWGVVGVLLFEAYLTGWSPSTLYDASIHALAVGFVGTMFLAHGPIIFPVVTGRRLDELKINKRPLYILTLSVALRVVGDAAKGVVQTSAVDTLVWLSGWLILLTVILFLGTLVRATTRQVGAQPEPAKLLPPTAGGAGEEHTPPKQLGVHRGQGHAGEA